MNKYISFFILSFLKQRHSLAKCLVPHHAGHRIGAGLLLCLLTENWRGGRRLLCVLRDRAGAVDVLVSHRALEACSRAKGINGLQRRRNSQIPAS
jgi:hypothetical protein